MIRIVLRYSSFSAYIRDANVRSTRASGPGFNRDRTRESSLCISGLLLKYGEDGVASHRQCQILVCFFLQASIPMHVD